MNRNFTGSVFVRFEFIAGLVWLAFSLWLPGSIFAQDQQPTQSQSPKREQLQRQLESITPQRKTELRKFARENMPELGKLMSVLHERNPAQFQRLLLSLNQTYQKLQVIKKSGNEAHYATVLENWKLETRIKMLSAQMSFRDMPNAENRLKRLIVGQIDIRKEMIRQEKAKLEARMKKLESNLSKLENDQSGEVERRLKAALKSSENMRAKREASKNESRSESKDEADEESSRVPGKKPNRNRKPKSAESESTDSEAKEPSTEIKPESSTESVTYNSIDSELRSTEPSTVSKEN